MDMWGPYIAATLEMIPEALTKIAFDRFHVARHLGDAVDKVRRAEHRALVKEGNEILTGSKYQWLKGRGRKTHREKLAFARLRAGTSRCRLDPVVKAARMVHEHLWGIVNAVISGATNGPAEGINSRIKTIKARSRGFRNQERFANAIYFHLGGLDLYPDGLTHDQSPT